MTNMSNRYQMSELLSAIQSADSVLLFPHISPDGDTIGSTLAVKMLLTRLKKHVTIVLDDVPPASLSFLPDIYCIRAYEEAQTAIHPTEHTLALSVDVSSEDRMGRALALYRSAGITAQIDHHFTNPGFAQINVIDGEASASAVLVYRLFTELGLPLRREEAICLYTALSTDTGNFVYQNTNAEAFQIMEQLMKAELPVELIDAVNQLLELKMNSPEVRLIPKIPEINEYLDKGILDIKSAVRLLDDNHTPGWKELNQLFLQEINRARA